MSEQKNCVDIAWSFEQAMAAEPEIRHQLIGGIGSAALVHQATKIDADDTRVIAPPDLYVSQYRDAAMTNLRDLDDMVLTTDRATTARVETIAEEIIQDQLKCSIFGLHETQELDRQVAHPLAASMQPKRSLLADRYVLTDQDDILLAHKAVFPFAARMDLPTLETWTLSVGQRDMPIPHPGATILNYLTRSISGLRPKDREKVDALTKLTLEKMPDLLEWLEDGPGASQLKLARILHSLREPEKAPQPLVLGGKLAVRPLKLATLIELPEFMAGSCPLPEQRIILSIARAKARTLHFGERFEKVVSYWQNNVEPRIDRIVKNN